MCIRYRNKEAAGTINTYGFNIAGEIGRFNFVSSIYRFLLLGSIRKWNQLTLNRLTFAEISI